MLLHVNPPSLCVMLVETLVAPNIALVKIVNVRYGHPASTQIILFYYRYIVNVMVNKLYSSSKSV